MTARFLMHDVTGDCHDENGRQDYCASGAINNYTSQLTKFELPPPNLITTKVRETQCKCLSILSFIQFLYRPASYK